MTVTLRLHYPISANVYWRSFVPKGHQRAIVTLSDAAKKYKKAAHDIALLAGVRKPIAGRVMLTIVLHPKCPQDAAKRARLQPDTWEESVQCIDLDNALKVTIDSLKGIVMVDDNQIWRLTAERGEPVDGGAVIVTVTPIATPSRILELPLVARDQALPEFSTGEPF